MNIHKLYIDLDLNKFRSFYCIPLLSPVYVFQFALALLFFSGPVLLFLTKRQKYLFRRLIPVCSTARCQFFFSLVIQHFCGSGLKFLLLKIQLFKLTYHVVSSCANVLAHFIHIFSSYWTKHETCRLCFESFFYFYTHVLHHHVKDIQLKMMDSEPKPTATTPRDNIITCDWRIREKSKQHQQSIRLLEDLFCFSFSRIFFTVWNKQLSIRFMSSKCPSLF